MKTFTSCIGMKKQCKSKRLTSSRMKPLFTQVLWLLVIAIIAPQIAYTNDITWTGNGDGTSWNQSGNWSSGAVPTSGDNVFITMDGTYTITISTSVTINDLTFSAENGNPILVKQSGTLTINGDALIGENNTLIMNAGYIDGDGKLVNRGLIISDASNWTGIRGFHLVNESTLEHRNGILYLAQASIFENEGLFSIEGDFNIMNSGSAGTFVNYGTLHKSAGENNSRMGTHLDSRPESRIESNSGTLQFEGNTSLYSTSLHAAANSELRFQSGTVTFRGDITGSPNGIITLNTGSRAHEDGATINFDENALRWTSSYFTGDGVLTNLGILHLDASNWAGVNGARMINRGSVYHWNGIFYLTQSAVLENEELFSMEEDLFIGSSGSVGRFINFGTLRKSAGDENGRVTVEVESRPQSLIESQSGSLRFERNTELHNMTLFSADDAAIHFHSGTLTFRGTISGSPLGDIILDTDSRAHDDGASINFDENALRWASSYFTGNGVLTNLGTIHLDASNWTGLNGARMINRGNMYHRSGIFYIAQSAVLENEKLFSMEDDLHINSSGSVGTFVNNGILRKTGGDENGRITVILESNPESVVESLSGSLRQERDSYLHNTTLYAEEGARLILQSGRHNLRGSISGSPAGFVEINADIEAHEEGAVLNFDEAGIRWVSSYQRPGGALTNSGLITIDAPNWAGVINASLINDGEIRHQRGIFYVSNSGLLENRASYFIEDDVSILNSGARGTFINSGLLRKSTSDGLSEIAVAVENRSTATIEVLSGRLNYSWNSFHDRPTFTVPNVNATLSFHNGEHIFAGNISLNPAGTVIIRTNFRADPSGAVFNIGGTGLQWQGGRLLDGGVLTNSGTITASTSATKGVTTTTLINTGLIEYLEGSFALNTEGVLKNRGSFQLNRAITLSTTIQSRGKFENRGLFSYNNDGLTTVQAEFYNLESSVLEQTGGELRFTSKLLNEPDASIRSDGTLHVLSAEFTHLGALESLSDTSQFEVLGDFSAVANTTELLIALSEAEENGQRPNSQLYVRELNPNSFIRQGGQAVLGGKLSLRHDESFTPQPGTEFEIIRTDRGISGVFIDMSTLVDEINQRTYYPQVHDNSLFLTTAEGVQVLDSDISVSPGEVPAAGIRSVTITGTGFSPDMTATLSCVNCESGDENEESPIPGGFSSVTPEKAETWFDLTSVNQFGEYELLLKDPRGGEATATLFVTDGGVALSVQVLKQPTGGGRDPGLFLITSNRPVNERISIPYTLSGSAQIYQHYTTDLLGGTIRIEAGTDSVVVAIFPLNTGDQLTRTVSLQLNYTQPPISEVPDQGPLFATMQIRSADTSGEFRVLNKTPNRGGNVGLTTMTLTGQGFTNNSSVTLSGGGPTAVAHNITVNETGTKMTGTFDLVDQPIGMYDVVVNSGAGKEVTLSSAFQVETGLFPEVHVQVFAPVRVPRIRLRTYTIILENRGNVDVYGYPALAGLPINSDWQIDPAQFDMGSSGSVSWNDIAPVFIDPEREEMTITFPYLSLSPNQTRRIDVTTSIPTSQVIELVAAWFYD